MDIEERIRERGIDKGGVGSDRSDRERADGGYVMKFEREFIGRKLMREKIWKDGVFYSWQGWPLNFLDPIQESKSLLWLNIPSIGKEQCPMVPLWHIIFSILYSSSPAIRSGGGAGKFGPCMTFL